MRRASLITLAALLGGCTLIADFGKYGDDEVDGASQPMDSGMRDAGSTDSGATDAGSLDGGTTDGGVRMDASPPVDAHVPDDAGVDSGSPMLDAGRPEPTWEPAVRLGHGDLDNEQSNWYPRVAVAANGDALITFYDQGTVWARRYDHASGTFSPLFEVSDASSVGNNALVAIDDDGNGIIAWGGSGATTGVFARRFDASLGWPAGWGVVEAVQPSEGTGRVYTVTALDMTGDGHVVVAWHLRHWMASPEVNRTYFRIFARGHGWRDRVVLSGASTRSGWCGAAIARLGPTLRVVGAFTHHNGTVTDVIGAVYDQDLATGSGSLGAEVALETEATAMALSPRVAMDDAGNAIALFVLRSGSMDSVTVNRFSSGVWSGAMVFNPSGSYSYTPRLSVAGAGEAFVVWRQCSPTCAIWSRRFTGGAWQPSLQVSTTESSAASPAVAVRDDGRALAVWTQNQATLPSVFASEHASTSGWTSGHALEDDHTNDHGEGLDVGFADADVGLAVWVREAEGTSGPRRIIFGALYR